MDDMPPARVAESDASRGQTPERGGAERRECVRIARVPRVVAVEAGGAGRLDEPPHLRGRRHADRVREDELDVAEVGRELDYPPRIDATLERTPEADAERDRRGP